MSTAQDRGWGTGWPNCQADKITTLVVSGVGFPGGIRQELHDLVFVLLQECERRGYKLKLGECWGFGCRPIKRSDGTLTQTPSNHSWGLAIDVNAPSNSFGGATHDIPKWMADLFKRFGFRWGGDYLGTKDWMHFEFMGTPRAADTFETKAKAEFLDVDYIFKGRRYERMKGVLAAFRARLKASKAGTKLAVRVVKGGN